MAPLTLNPVKTALVVIDLQKGIAAMPTEPRSAAEVIQNDVRLANALRDHGGFVVWVRVAMAPDGKDRLQPPCDAPMAAGTQPPPDWSELLPELGIRPGDHVITKKQWGAFFGTDLDLQLRRRHIETIIMGGIATCFGVESTARDAYELGYAQVFAEDAMASRSAAEHEHCTTRIFPRMGLVRTTAEIVEAIQASRY